MTIVTFACCDRTASLTVETSPTGTQSLGFEWLPNPPHAMTRAQQLDFREHVVRVLSDCWPDVLWVEDASH
jgi:hypothetical protein